LLANDQQMPGSKIDETIVDMQVQTIAESPINVRKGTARLRSSESESS